MTAAAKTSKPAGAISKRQFLAVVVDAVTREAVKASAMQLGWQNAKILEGGADAALEIIEGNAPPGFLLVDLSGSADPLSDMRALAGSCGSETRVVAIGMVNDVGLYRQLLDMGVSDYLVKPVSSQVLMAAIEAAMREQQSTPERRAPGRVLAIIGARGGVGASTLALSVAWSLSEQQQQRVVLLDLDLHFGSLALSLDLEPGRGLREILSSPDRIDSLLIDAAMTGVSERLRVIGAEEPLEDHLAIGEEGLVTLLADLATGADCVVVDLPRSLGPMTRHILRTADTIAIVSDLSLPSMRDTQRLMAMIQAIRADADTRVIVNRMGGVPGEVSRSDFERGIGGKVAFAVPFDANAATAAAERAKPFMEVARQPKTVAQLEALALGLVGAEPSAPRPSSSFLSRLIGK